MNQQMAESTMHVFRLHVSALRQDRRAAALERIKGQRFFTAGAVSLPLSADDRAFIAHIAEPEVRPLQEEERNWLIDAMDPARCAAAELNQLFLECQRAGDGARAAYLLGCRDVRVSLSLLEGTDEWRELESVAEKSEISCM